MTNLGKAKEKINKVTFYNALDEKCVDCDTANEAIELASQQDWKYPAKCEFPDVGMYVNVVIERNGVIKTTIAQWDKESFLFIHGGKPTDNVIAWCELPKYEQK